MCPLLGDKVMLENYSVLQVENGRRGKGGLYMSRLLKHHCFFILISFFLCS